MVSKKLADWIKSEKAQGHSKKELREALTKRGYKKKEIDEAISSVPPKPNTKKSFKSLIKKWWFWLILALTLIFLILVGTLFIRSQFSSMTLGTSVDRPAPEPLIAKTAPPIKLLEYSQYEVFDVPRIFNDRIYYNAKIPYEHDPNDFGRKVLSSYLDGSDAKFVTLGTETLLNPLLSPDGTKIAFVGRDEDAYILDLTKSTQLNYDEQEFWEIVKDEENRWDPSGKKITSPDGSLIELEYGLTKITDEGLGSNPMSWSKDGRRIVFEHWSDGSSEIYFKEVLDGNMNIYPDILERETELVDKINKADRRFQPSYGPNGEIVFITVSKNGQKIVHKDSSGIFTFINLHEQLFGAPLHPQYSPDGSKIAFINAFEKQGLSFHRNVYVINSDFNNLNLRKITDTKSFKSNLQWLDNENIIYVDNPDLTLSQPDIFWGSFYKVNINEVTG